MPGKLRLRDFLAGHRQPPPRRSTEPADLIREAEDADPIDVEEAARQCARSAFRLWERVERLIDEEKRRGQ